MKLRVITGITPSGNVHLGNILGAILPAIAMSRKANHECFYFIADYHALTTNKDPQLLKKYLLNIASAWLAFGYDYRQHFFFRQSKVKDVCELAWILSNVTPYTRLLKSHAFKEKSTQLTDVNIGLFTYPVLMSADILLYKSNVVPVGMDQKQHVEIARDIAAKFNAIYGEVFILPEAIINTEVATIPGTDGRKMSKSYGNYIDVFLPKDQLKKRIASIVTDSKGISEPKNPSTCHVFKIYAAVAKPEMIAELKDKYLSKNYGYGQAKAELLNLLWSQYEEQRDQYHYYIEHPDVVNDILLYGEQRACQIASTAMQEVKARIGLSL